MAANSQKCVYHLYLSELTMITSKAILTRLFQPAQEKRNYCEIDLITAKA